MGHCRTDSNDRGSIVFLCNNVNEATSVTMSDERMRITSTGNVGIGTNPTYKLHVSGTTMLNGEVFFVENTWIRDGANRVKLYFSSDSRTIFQGVLQQERVYHLEGELTTV